MREFQFIIIHHNVLQEGEVSPYGPLASSSHQGSMNDLSLYSSPSMPNISLGRPPIHSSWSEGAKLAPFSEAEVRAACTARLGMPLTGQMLPGTLPYYPTLPGWWRWRDFLIVATDCINRFWVWVWSDIYTDMGAFRGTVSLWNSSLYWNHYFGWVLNEYEALVEWCGQDRLKCQEQT